MEASRGQSDADKPDTAHASVGEFKVKRTKERELERKRARGEVSCAECRRLKLKCNKKVPCSSCVRRGCHSICPNGALSTGQGSRFVLANTRKLHTKLLDMSQRIRQLEDALHIAQATLSSQQHPLLSADLLKIKAGVDEASGEPSEPQHMLNPEDDDDEEEEGVTAGIGTLSITERGEARFIGRVAAEALLINQPADAVACPANSSKAQIEEKLPDEIVGAARGFPFMRADLPSQNLFALLEEHLPSYQRATALAEAYLENVNWLPRPIQREQIFEELIPAVYKYVECQQTTDDGSDENIKAKALQKMHTLALIFALFACGAAADLTMEPQNTEGMLFSYVARAALNAHSVFDFGASLETIQALQLISTYDFFSCSAPTLESSWKVMTFGMILATSIGLHRDPARWGLDENQIQRRRALFWELSSIDKFKCLGSGRPAMFHLREIDCEFPADKEQFVRPDGTIREGPYSWRMRFSKCVVGPIAETLSEMRPIKYSEILEFDRKIREFDNPPFDLALDDKVDIYNIQGHMWHMYKDISLLFLHRNFFARAMIKHSDNPLRSPFAPSFLAAYAGSIKLLRQIRKCYLHNPAMLLRMWPVWAHALTSGVIVGTVAARVKNVQLASAAFQDLILCVKLFEDAQKHPVAARGLPMLVRLRDRALRTFAGDTLPKQPGSESDGKQEEEDPDFELSILRGGAQYIQSGWSRSRGGKKPNGQRIGLMGHLLRNPDSPPASAKQPRENGSQSPQASAPSPGDATRGSETSSTGLSSQGDITPGIPLLSSPSSGDQMDSIPKPPVDVNEMDVNMLMNWLASDDITSSNNPPILSPKLSSNFDPLLNGPNPQWNYNIANDSPESGQDMADFSPAQGVAWLNQTFDSQAAPVAEMFNMSSLLGLPDPHAFLHQNGMQQQAGPSAPGIVHVPQQPQQVAGASASSMFAPPFSGNQGMNDSMDFSWVDGLYSGSSNNSDNATNRGSKSGEDQSFMDAWRMQAAVEGLEALPPPSNSYSNLF